MLSSENDPYTPLVKRVMEISDITWGASPARPGKQDFIVRYRGQIINPDTAAAFDELEDLVKPLNLTPLFRLEDGQHSIHLLQGRIQPKPSNPLWNLVMFVLSAVSVLLAGFLYSYQGPIAADAGFADLFALYLANWKIGMPFAASFLAILGAHEFGHYLAARYHKTAVTLPYFMPFPFSPFGTLGAFIQIKELPKNKRTMLDIGLAGPLAGLVVAIPVLIYGLSISKIDLLPTALTAGSGLSLEGNSLLYLFLKYLVKGELLPAPASYGSIPPLFYWIRYVLTSTPLPIRRPGCPDEPGRLGGLGWSARDLLEPYPRRPAGWRSCHLCPLWQSKSAQTLAFHFGWPWAPRFCLDGLVFVGFSDLLAGSGLYGTPRPDHAPG